MDLRGHGKSSTENELDLSIEVSILLNSHIRFFLMNKIATPFLEQT